MSSDFFVNDFVSNTLNTACLRNRYKFRRATLKNDDKADKTSTYCDFTTLSAVYKGGCLVRDVDILVKSAPKNTELRKCIPVNELFIREALFYEEIVPEFMKLQNKKEKDEQRFQGAPALMAGTIKDGEETLIFNTCNEEWFPRFEKYDGKLTPEHLNIVLKELGRFHTLSFALKKTNPEKYDEFKTKLRGGYLSNLQDSHTLSIIHNNLNCSLKHFSDEIVQKLTKFDQEIDSFLDDVLNRSNDNDVIVHGDFTSNFLFRNKLNEKWEISDIVSQTKFFNWQLTKFGSPVLDLSGFIFTNFSLEDPKKVEELLKEYHAILTTSLKELKCDVGDFLPIKRLEEEWKTFAKFGLALAFLNFQVISLDPSTRPNANREESAEDFLQRFIAPPNENFIARIKELVKYCVNELI